MEAFVEHNQGRLARRLTGVYVRWTAWFLLGVALLWLVGVEGIYRHPTPFYAYFLPATESLAVVAMVLAAMWLCATIWCFGLFPEANRGRGRLIAAVTVLAIGLGVAAWRLHVEAEAAGLSIIEGLQGLWNGLRWHLLAVAVFFGFVALWWHGTRQVSWFEGSLPKRLRRWMLVGLVGFCILFPSTVAMIRGGPDRITTAYSNHPHEYTYDFGIRNSFRELFRDYVELHPMLSTHAKVHPPGPIVLLWFLADTIAGREPYLGLSLATIAIGSLALFPLYLWVRDMADERVALTCCLLYALMPSIVLFTATSADILFMPFTLTTLFLFWRAIHRKSWLYAIAAGTLYAVLSLLSFSLLAIGAFFAFVGLWRLADRKLRWGVVQTAVVMVAAFLATHAAVRFWSGFDVIACFQVCKAQFLEDQLGLDVYAPRYPGWVYRFLNPACWAFFAGIPVTALFVWRLTRPEPSTKGIVIVCALTLVALDLLYLARGEGERSAMYVLPFLVVPAALLLDQLGRLAQSCRPMLATFVFLGLQCWLIETLLNTYW